MMVAVWFPGILFSGAGQCATVGVSVPMYCHVTIYLRPMRPWTS